MKRTASVSGLRFALLLALVASLLPQAQAADLQRTAGYMQIQRVMRDGSLICETPYGEIARITLNARTLVEHDPLAAGEIIEVTYAEPVDDGGGAQYLRQFEATAARIRGAVFDGLIACVDPYDFSADFQGPMVSGLTPYKRLLLPKTADILAIDSAYVRFTPVAAHGLAFTDGFEMRPPYTLLSQIEGIVEAADATGLDVTAQTGKPLRVYFDEDTRVHRVLDKGTQVVIYYPFETARRVRHWLPDPDEVTATSVWPVLPNG